MSTIINRFMLLPFWARAAILLFLLMIVFWSVFRKIILWIMSGVPFFLGKMFRYVYLAVEIPVAALHKRFGRSFYKIDNQLSRIGEKIDCAVGSWYNAWHSPEKYSFGRAFLIYIVCMAFIALPAFIKTDNILLNAGERVYKGLEDYLVLRFEKQGWYEAENQIEMTQGEQSAAKIEETPPFETELVVSGISTSLLVRDKPSVEEGDILGRLKNEDIVIWRGEMCFSEIDGDHVEPWVKIITPSGVEGWSRLFYLHPEPYEDIQFQVTD